MGGAENLQPILKRCKSRQMRKMPLKRKLRPAETARISEQLLSGRLIVLSVAGPPIALMGWGSRDWIE